MRIRREFVCEKNPDIVLDKISELLQQRGWNEIDVPIKWFLKKNARTFTRPRLFLRNTLLQVYSLQEEHNYNIKFLFWAKGLKFLDIFRRSKIVEDDLDWVITKMITEQKYCKPVK